MKIGTLSCSPGIARLQSAAGNISIDSLDGNACIASQATAPSAELTVHAQDNLESLSVQASCAVNLILSPDLVKKVHCSTEPEALKAKLPEGVKLQGSQDSFALAKCSDKEEAQESLDSQKRLPSIYIACQGNLSAKVESWFESLARRKKMSPVNWWTLQQLQKDSSCKWSLDVQCKVSPRLKICKWVSPPHLLLVSIHIRRSAFLKRSSLLVSPCQASKKMSHIFPNASYVHSEDYLRIRLNRNSKHREYCRLMW